MSESNQPAYKNPYVGPRPFKEDEKLLFFGREQEAQSLLSQVISEPLLLFYAQSGAGKSSLLNTRIVPNLRDEGFTVLPIGRVGGSSAEGFPDSKNPFVFNLILSLEKDSPSSTVSDLKDLSLSEYLSSKKRKDSPPESRVLIIDQFEEILTTYPLNREGRADFFIQLNEAILNDDFLWVLLTMREDYAASLDPFLQLLSNRLQARFYMQRMQETAALAAVQKPAASAGRLFAEGVAEKLVGNLRRIRVPDQVGLYQGQFIEPVQLQIVCYQLWQNIQGKLPGLITHADLNALGDIDNALTKFYERVLKQTLEATNVSELMLRSWFEKQLITEAETRGTVYQGAHKTGELDNGVVRFLENQFLLRAEIRAGGTWYELIHDSFIVPILKANQVWRLGQSSFLQAAQKWQDSNYDRSHLYRDQQLQEALASINPESAEPLLRQFLEASIAAQAQQDLAEKQAEVEEKRKEAAAKEQRAAKTWRVARILLVLFGIGVTIVIIALLLGLVADNRAEAAVIDVTKSYQEQETAVASSLIATQQQGEGIIAMTRAITQQGTAQAINVNAQIQFGLAANDLATAESDLAVANAQRIEAENLLATATVNAAGAILESQAADNAFHQVKQQQQLILAQSLAANARSIALRQNDTELAILLAKEADNIMVELFDQLGNANDVRDLEGIQNTLVQVFQYVAEQDYLNGSLFGHSGAIHALAFQGDGRLVSAGSDGLIRTWNLNAQGHPFDDITGNEGSADLMAITPNGNALAMASTSGNVDLWTTSTGVSRAFSLDKAIEFLTLSNSGSRIAVIASDNYAYFWQQGYSEPIRLRGFPENGFERLIFSPGGNRLMALERGGGTYTWGLPADSFDAPVIQPAILNIQIAFSPNRQLAAYNLVSLENEGETAMPVRNLANGLFYGTEESDNTLSLPVAFSYDGQLFVDTDFNVIRLWQLGSPSRGTSQILSQLVGHADSISALSFSPDGRFIASGSIDGSIRVWWENNTIPIASETACELVQRNLTWAEWQTYIGEGAVIGYRQTCPNLPKHYTVP